MTQEAARLRTDIQSIFATYVRAHTERLIMVALFIGALVMALPFRSLWFDDLDSANFALAMKTYNPTYNMPHPPGYPVYIFMLRVWNGVLSMFAPGVEPETTMATLSCIATAATLVLVYVICRRLWGRVPALLAVLALFFMPLFRLIGEQTMSGMVSTAFFVGVLLASVLALETRERRWLFGASLVLGLYAGIRPVDAFCMLPAFLLVMWTFRSWRSFWAASGILAAATMVWLIPSVIDMHGIGSYLKMLEGKTTHTLTVDAVTNGMSLMARYTKILGYVVVGYGWMVVALGLLGIAAALITKRKAPVIFLMTAQLPMLAFYLIFGASGAEWYWLPTAVVLGIFMAPLAGAVRASVPSMTLRGVILGAFLLTLLPMAAASQRMVTALHHTPSAPVQMAHYIAAHYKSASTLIVAGTDERILSRYLPGYKIVLDTSPLADVATQAGRLGLARQGYKTVLVTSAAHTAKVKGLTLIAKFTRDPHLHQQYSSEDLSLVPPAIPSDALLSLAMGTPEARPFLTSGWSFDEHNSDETWVWTDARLGPTASITFPVRAVDSGSYDLTLRAASIDPRETVAITLNRLSLGTISVPNPTGAYQDYTLPIKAVLLRAGSNVLDLTPTPAMHSKQDPTDGRLLGVQVAWVVITKARGP